MALIKCPQCGKPVSDRAKKCPHCGFVNSAAMDTEPYEALQTDEYYADYDYSHESTGGSRKRWIWVLVIAAVLLAGGIAALLVSNHNKQMQAQEQARQDSIAAVEEAEAARLAAEAAIEQARQDSIAAEQARQDSIKAVHQDIIRLYKNKTRQFAASDDGYEGHYFLYDITHDGIPELWLCGMFGCSYMNVYTYSKGELKCIYTGPCGHSSYYKGNGYVLECFGHMGHGAWIKLNYNGGRIVEHTLYEEFVEPNDDYRRPDEPMMKYIDVKNLSPINSMF